MQYYLCCGVHAVLCPANEKKTPHELMMSCLISPQLLSFQPYQSSTVGCRIIGDVQLRVYAIGTKDTTHHIITSAAGQAAPATSQGAGGVIFYYIIHNTITNHAFAQY